MSFSCAPLIPRFRDEDHVLIRLGPFVVFVGYPSRVQALKSLLEHKDE